MVEATPPQDDPAVAATQRSRLSSGRGYPTAAATRYQSIEAIQRSRLLADHRYPLPVGRCYPSIAANLSKKPRTSETPSIE